MENPYWLGLIGAALPDAIRLIKGRHNPALPAYLKSITFWLGFVLLLGIGVLAVYLGEPPSVKEALAYGFGAPEIVSRLLSSEGLTAGQADRGAMSLRGWWAH